MTNKRDYTWSTIFTKYRLHLPPTIQTSYAYSWLATSHWSIYGQANNGTDD